MFKLTYYYYSVLIGILLSDVWIRFGLAKINNVRFGFAQSIKIF